MPSPTKTDELNTDAIQESLTTQSLGRSLHILESTASTNSLALTLAESGEPNMTVVLAEHQTAGKGRLGRDWASPGYQNIYCSVILKNPSFQKHLTWIPLVTGLAIVQALEETRSIHASLKWPNDFLIGQRKLGGVLCESTSHGSQPNAVIVGFGMNVNSNTNDFPPELQPLVTSLFLETKKKSNRNTLLAGMLNRLERCYDQLAKQNLEEIRTAYSSACSTIGRDVEVSLIDGKVLVGKAVSIDTDGALQVTLSQNGSPETIAVRSADIRHLK